MMTLGKNENLQTSMVAAGSAYSRLMIILPIIGCR